MANFNMTAPGRDADGEVLLNTELLEEHEEEQQAERPNFVRINKAFEYAQELRDASRAAVRAKLCRAFYESKQYMRWDEMTQEIVEDDVLKKLGLWDNIIRPNVDLIAAKAGMGAKRLEAVPGPNRQSSVDAAQIATAYLEMALEQCGWPMVEGQIGKVLQIDGVMYVRLSWDPGKVDYVPFVVMDDNEPPVEMPNDDFEFQERVPYKNMWLDIVRGPFGAPKLDLLPLEQVYPPPNVEDISEAKNFWIVEDAVAITEIAETYPDMENKPEPQDTTNEEHNDRPVFDTDEMVGGETFSRKVGVARIYHYFEQKGGMWRKVSYLEKQQTDDGYLWLNPKEPEHEEHGVIQAKFSRLPRRYYCNGTVWDMMPLQLARNLSLVSLVANSELSSRPVLTSRGQAVFTPGLFCHTVEIPDEASANEVMWSTIPNTTQQSLQVMEAFQQMADRSAIVHDVSQGKNMPKQMSGKALEALISQQDIAPNRMAEEIQRVGIEVGKRLLAMARTHFVESRLLPVTDRNREMRILTSGSLPAMASVRPVFSRYIPRDQLGRIEALQMLAGLGWFQTGNEGPTRRMAKFLEMRSSEIEDMLPTDQLVRNQVERDLEEIESDQAFVKDAQVYGMNGEPMVQAWHDHAAWLLEAQTFLMSDRYRDEWRDSPEKRAMFATVVDSHRRAIAQDSRPPDAAIVAAMAQLIPNVDPDEAAKTWEQIKAVADQSMQAANAPAINNARPQ